VALTKAINNRNDLTLVVNRIEIINRSLIKDLVTTLFRRLESIINVYNPQRFERK